MPPTPACDTDDGPHTIHPSSRALSLAAAHAWARRPKVARFERRKARHSPMDCLWADLIKRQPP